MSKRIAKKKLAKENLQRGYIFADGNNGADIIEIEEKGEGLIKIYSGSCCVPSINAIVPVEFITAIIMEKMLQCNNDINKVIDSFGWDREYKDILKKKVVRSKWYE